MPFRRVLATPTVPTIEDMSAPTSLLGGTGTYVHWGFVQISVANLVVIALMVLVFVAALVVPFPHTRDRDRDDDGSRG